MSQSLVEMGTVARLLAFVDAVHPRSDWHEPDEQGITAEVVGRTLDNAFGDWPQYGYIYPRDSKSCVPMEKIVVLQGNDGNLRTVEVSLNLASLLALATVGARTLTDSAAKVPKP